MLTKTTQDANIIYALYNASICSTGSVSIEICSKHVLQVFPVHSLLSKV